MSTHPLSIAEVNQHLANAANMLDHALQKQGLSLKNTIPWGRGYITGSGQYQEHWLSFVELVQKTDYSELSPRQTRKLRRALAHTLPKVAKRAAYLGMAQDFNAAAKKLEYWLPKYGFEVAQRKSIARVAKLEMERFNSPKVITTKTIPRSSIPPKLNFPDLAGVNHQVDYAVKKLRLTWEKAINLPDLTTEDQFLLQRIVTDYLPDTWRMYTTISDMPSRVTDQAAAMVLTQLDVLNGRVQEITARHGGAALKELRAQTVFINRKKSAPHTGDTLRIP